MPTKLQSIQIAIFVVFATLCFGWSAFVAPYFSRLPSTFNFEANINSIDNFFNPATGQFSGEVPSLTKFTYHVTDTKDNVLEVENDFDVRKPNGEKIFSVMRKYGIDSQTGAHVNGHGDEDRDGFLFAPKNLQKQDYVYWHVNYDTGTVMRFQNEETIDGLKVYRYQSNFQADQTKNLTNLPGVGVDKGVVLDVSLQVWIEPVTGQMLKYQDNTVAYYYDLQTRQRLNPWNSFSNTFDPSSVVTQAQVLKNQVQRIYFVTFGVPIIFALIAVILLLRAKLSINGIDPANDRIMKKAELFSSIQMVVLPLAALALSLLLTRYLWIASTDSIQKLAETEFNRRTNDTKGLISNRLQNYENALRSARGFYAASDNVSRVEWSEFVAALDIEKNYPGLSTFTFLTRVSEQDKLAFIDLVKKDKSLNPAGYPDFTIYPESQNQDHVVLTYVAPLTEEREKSLGLDYSVELERRSAVQRAIETGVTSATAPILSVTTKQPTFVFLLPIYQKNAPIDSALGRQQSYSGLISTGFQIKPFFETLLGKYDELKGIELHIFDGTATTTDRELFQIGSLNTQGRTVSQKIMSQSVPIDVGGRIWTLTFMTNSLLGISELERNTPNLILIFGVSISVASAFILYLLLSSNKRAYSKVNSITKDLKASEEKYRTIFESMTDVLYRTDLQGKITMMSPSIEKYIGIPAEQLIGQDASSLYLDPENRKVFIETITRDGSVSDFPIQLTGPSGQKFDVSVNAHLLLDSEDKPIGIEGVLRDLSERKKNEDKVIEKKEELERVNKIMIDRELKMIELKKELEALKKA